MANLTAWMNCKKKKKEKKEKRLACGVWARPGYSTWHGEKGKDVRNTRPNKRHAQLVAWLRRSPLLRTLIMPSFSVDTKQQRYTTECDLTDSIWLS